MARMAKLHQLSAGLDRQTNRQAARPTYSPEPVAVEPGDELLWVDVDVLEDNPFQPRQTYHAEDQQRMVLDLNRDGQLEAVQVRIHPEKPGFYQLTSGGHSRKYAVKDGAEFTDEQGRTQRIYGNAGSQMPNPEQYRGKLQVILKKQPVTDLEMRRRAWRENKGRADTRPVDEARFFEATREHLTKEWRAEGRIKPNSKKQVPWQAVAEFLGEKGYIQVWRLAQLLKLPPEMVKALEEGTLQPGHGEALWTLREYPKYQKALFNRILKEGLDTVATTKAAQKTLATVTGKVRPEPIPGEELLPEAVPDPAPGGGADLTLVDGGQINTRGAADTTGTRSEIAEVPRLMERLMMNLGSSEFALADARKKVEVLDIGPGDYEFVASRVENIEAELRIIKRALKAQQPDPEKAKHAKSTLSPARIEREQLAARGKRRLKS